MTKLIQSIHSMKIKIYTTLRVQSRAIERNAMWVIRSIQFG